MTKLFLACHAVCPALVIYFPDPVVCVFLSVIKITQLFSLVQWCLGHAGVSSLFSFWWRELLENTITVFTVWKVKQALSLSHHFTGKVKVPVHVNRTLESHGSGAETTEDLMNEPQMVVTNISGQEMWMTMTTSLPRPLDINDGAASVPILGVTVWVLYFPPSLLHSQWKTRTFHIWEGFPRWWDFQ